MNKYRINPKYSLILKKSGQLLCSNKDKYICIDIDENEKNYILEILENEMFKKQDSKIFKILDKKKIIIKCINTTYSRNTNLYLNTYTDSNVNMNDLYDKKVLIIGLGGVGCEVITHLVGNGVNSFVILDYDDVDNTNFNRQYLYSEDDISKNKVQIITKKIKEKKSNANVVGYNLFINDSKELMAILNKEKVDIVVCAADTPFLDIRIFILEACIGTNIPCIFGGVGVLKGQYGPTFIDKNKMKKYLEQLYKVKELVECNNINKASFGPTNTIISAYMAMDVIFTLLNKKKYINSLNRIKELDFIKRVDNEEKRF